jgi:hypothetical protein
VLEGLKKVKADVFVNIGNDTSGTQQILTRPEARLHACAEDDR